MAHNYFAHDTKRDASATKCFFDMLTKHNEVLDRVTMDNSSINKAVLDGLKAKRESPTEIQQIKYLSNIVEQDLRAIKRVTRPMTSFKSFRTGRAILAGIELMHMIRKGQCTMPGSHNMSFAGRFYRLAGRVRPQ